MLFQKKKKGLLFSCSFWGRLDLCKQVLFNELMSFKFHVSMCHHLHRKSCKALAQGIQGVTSPGNLKKTCRCGTWSGGGYVSSELMFGLNDLERLFQTEEFCDSMVFLLSY